MLKSLFANFLQQVKKLMNIDFDDSFENTFRYLDAFEFLFSFSGQFFLWPLDKPHQDGASV